MDQTEVTTAMYARCVEDGACSPPVSFASLAHSKYYDDPDYVNYPVISVSSMYYYSSPDSDPVGPEIGTYRSLRGGSYRSDGKGFRVTN
jgi:formylglycine-generating enzyme required for sulfatase activity